MKGDRSQKPRSEDQPRASEPSTTSDTVEAPSAETRRSFLRGVGKKTVYMAPVFLVLSASDAQAASGDFDSTCGDLGSPCTVGADCCSNNCGGNMKCKMA